MKKIALILVLLMLLIMVTTVFADQDGHDTWCNEDQYGWWVTAEDGGKCYIMFWSEESRAYFMGGHSKPGELVMDKPNTSGGRLGMKSPSSKTWRDLLAEMINRHKGYLEGQGNIIPELIQKNIEDFDKSIGKGEMTESDVIDLINEWDDAYNKSE